MRACWIGCVVFASCGGPGANAPSTSAAELCSSSFPTGLFDSSPPGKGGGFGSRDSLNVSVKIGTTYTLKDPELVHQLVPDALIAAMNAARAPLGVVDHSFALADGPAHVSLRMYLTSDSTGDHYGANVTVMGLREGYGHGRGLVDMEQLFTYVVDPTYRTPEKLLAAIAEPATTYLYTGWVCDHGTAKKPQSCPFESGRTNEKWLECLGNRP